MNKPRILVIGLDGATFDLMNPLMAAGKLETLARIAQTGARGPLRSTIPPHSGPAWTSFATGMGPGRHGIYSFFARSFDDYTFPPVNSRQIRTETLWQRLSRAGLTVGVMNVPGTFPPTPINGFMITGMLSPSTEQAFCPPELQKRVLAQAPGYTVEALTLSDKAQYLESVQQSVQARTQAALYLLHEQPTDLFTIVFTELDRLQHFYWADMDPHHPCYSPLTTPDMAQAIEAGYIALDRAVQELLQAVDEDCLVLLVSDHGFEGVYKLFCVNKWLAEHGYLVLKERRAGVAMEHIKGGLQRLGLWQLARRARRLIPGTDDLRTTNLSYALDIDWERTQAAFGPNLGININLQGREPQGIVASGQEYAKLCDRLRQELESYTDPETGERVVSRVLRREDVYVGEAVDQAPDLRLLMAKSATYRGQYAYSPKVDADQALAFPDKVFGNHAEYGILLAQGPGIQAKVQVDGARLIDLAPTILYALGQPLPNTLDGRPLKAIFDSDFVAAHNEAAEARATASPTIAERAFDESEEQEVLDRLRNLGYLD